MRAKKPKLPSLQKYQLDAQHPGGTWEQSPPSFFSVRGAQEFARVQNYLSGTLIVIRRFVDGKIMYRNDDAKKAGL